MKKEEAINIVKNFNLKFKAKNLTNEGQERKEWLWVNYSIKNLNFNLQQISFLFCRDLNP